jgi:hypothetical protein
VCTLHILGTLEPRGDASASKVASFLSFSNTSDANPRAFYF